LNVIRGPRHEDTGRGLHAVYHADSKQVIPPPERDDSSDHKFRTWAGCSEKVVELPWAVQNRFCACVPRGCVDPSIYGRQVWDCQIDRLAQPLLNLHPFKKSLCHLHQAYSSVYTRTSRIDWSKIS
jgi:hypothetical protein